MWAKKQFIEEGVCWGSESPRLRQGLPPQETRWHLASGNKTGNRRHFGHMKRGNSQPPQRKESDFCAWGQGSVKMGWVWSLDYRNCFLWNWKWCTSMGEKILISCIWVLVVCIPECWNMKHFKSEFCQQKFNYGCKQAVTSPNWRGIDRVSVDRREDKGDEW